MSTIFYDSKCLFEEKHAKSLKPNMAVIKEFEELVFFYITRLERDEKIKQMDLFMSHNHHKAFQTLYR